MFLKKKLEKLKNIESLVNKKLKIKTNPLSVIEETKDKLGSFYLNLKKEREKEKIKAEKKKILDEKKDDFKAEVANDNSNGQIVVSGKNKDLDNLSVFLKDKNIKNVKLPVSAPFHCKLMSEL